MPIPSQPQARDWDVNGAHVSGALADDGSGWCWYCGAHHERATTKRTPCCGDCWFATAPPDPERP